MRVGTLNRMGDDTGDEMLVSVTDNPEAHRYEVRTGDNLAGFARYVRRGGRTYFVHTEVDPAFEGQGLGSALVRGALDAERGRGEPIVPLCPFVRAYVDRHPEDADLVDGEMLASIDNR
jgi:predicted GNAT family acetyltransferase